MKNDSLLIYKAIALSAVMFYIYKVSKENGGTLENNSMGLNISSDKIIDMASHFVTPEQRHNVRKYGRMFVQHMNGVRNHV